MISIVVPQGVKVAVVGGVVSVSGSLGSNNRKFNDALLSVAADSNGVVIKAIEVKGLAKKARVAENALAKEIRNDIAGVTEYFEIEMKSVHAHFPLSVEAKGNTVQLKNMIGERAPRVVSVMGNTKVEVKGQNIRVYGTKLDDVTQTAANLRKASKIRRKDERVFQDGVYYAIEE